MTPFMPQKEHGSHRGQEWLTQGDVTGRHCSPREPSPGNRETTGITVKTLSLLKNKDLLMERAKSVQNYFLNAA